ncbi:MAG: hypothetical protein K0S39_1519 [Paenibacillus sp.]|jgi:hypothetical protein|nr:hypothetical protein [Paenibacillus sp.]
MTPGNRQTFVYALTVRVTEECTVLILAEALTLLRDERGHC